MNKGTTRSNMTSSNIIQHQQQQTGAVGQQAGIISHLCAGCGHLIKDRYLLQALDSYWHEDCLKCGCCGCRLGEVGSNLFTRANLILCKRDYLRLFGTTGNCAACAKVIPAFEMVMRAKSNVYHLDCFACQQCHQRFCVGDKFYLIDNQILCEYDYEERLIFANLAGTGQNNNPFHRGGGGAGPPPAQDPPGENQQRGSSSFNTQQRSCGPWVSPTESLKSSGSDPFLGLLPPPPPLVSANSGSSSNNTKTENNSGASEDIAPPPTEDASSSGYGSPDSGGLIDEG